MSFSRSTTSKDRSGRTRHTIMRQGVGSDVDGGDAHGGRARSGRGHHEAACYHAGGRGRRGPPRSHVGGTGGGLAPGSGWRRGGNAAGTRRVAATPRGAGRRGRGHRARRRAGTHATRAHAGPALRAGPRPGRGGRARGRGDRRSSGGRRTPGGAMRRTRPARATGAGNDRGSGQRRRDLRRLDRRLRSVVRDIRASAAPPWAPTLATVLMRRVREARRVFDRRGASYEPDQLHRALHFPSRSCATRSNSRPRPARCHPRWPPRSSRTIVGWAPGTIAWCSRRSCGRRRPSRPSRVTTRFTWRRAFRSATPVSGTAGPPIRPSRRVPGRGSLGRGHRGSGADDGASRLVDPCCANRRTA